MADALHQAAVADDRERAVIDNSMARAVELRGERFLCDRHSDRIGKALAERAGCGLNARRDTDFGMTGSF